MKLISHFKQNPRILFLIDGIGALITASMLVLLLAPYPEFFGLPEDILYRLAFMASIFAIYSLTCFTFNPKVPGIYFRIIALANLSYCILSFLVVFYIWDQILIWGILYLLGEKIIVLSLVIIEFQMSLSTQSLFQSVYEDTDYSVQGFAAAMQVGESHPELNSLLNQRKKSTYGYLTAWNPRSRKLSEEENRNRNQELLARLQKIPGLIWLQGIAKSRKGGWPGEESFLILGITSEQMEQLSQQFAQNAYLFGEIDKPVQLIFTKL